MGAYLKRFGVPQDQIDALPLQIPKPTWALRGSQGHTGICALCHRSGTKKCGKCHSILYCSEECQKLDWQIHKVFCMLHPFPAKALAEDRGVQAILLPEKSKLPLLVHVPMERFLDDDDGCTYLHPKVEHFLGDTITGEIRSDYLPQRPFAHLPHAIHLKFREAFLKDGSAENACIAHLLGNEFPASMWRGSVVAMKSVGGQSDPGDPDYVDIEMQDTHDIVEFIRVYGLSMLSNCP